jgi:hypothetical protein
MIVKRFKDFIRECWLFIILGVLCGEILFYFMYRIPRWH